MIDLLPFLDHTEEYLKENVEGFKIEKRGKTVMLTCPFCLKTPLSCNIIPGSTYKLKCFDVKCEGNRIFTLVDIINNEEDKKEWSEEQVVGYLSEKFDEPVVKRFDVAELLDFYEAKGFDLVPIPTNSKGPVEKDWPNIEHKDRKEWEKWIRDGLNIGLKTGKSSGITVVDIDTKPFDIQGFIGDCFIQETPNGYHVFFEYDPDFPNKVMKDINIDIRNDGGQVVIAPSLTDGKSRKFLDLEHPITKMPLEVKEYLLEHAGKKFTSKNVKEQAIKNTQITAISTNDEGDVVTFGDHSGRNDLLIKLGGILRKKLNLEQTTLGLSLINKNFFSPCLDSREFNTIVRSLDRYLDFDESQMAEKVLDYLRIVDEAYANEVSATLGEQKEKIDKALSFLLREGKVLKARRMFQIVRKAKWKDSFDNLDNEITFDLPYFHDLGYWNWGDLILLGSKSKFGKTTISMNMIKSFVDQGIKPYYICLETGSRFIKTALKLGMKEGDFNWTFEADPTKIELEPNAITILDWLLVEDKSQTDSVMKHFIEQLYKTSGFLIIFMQLKMDGTWFAPNMIEQFPALAARYLYEKDVNGEYGSWHCEAIRDPKTQMKRATIPCQYDFQTKKLNLLEDNDKPKA